MEHYVEQALIEDIRQQEKLRTEEFISILDQNEKYFNVITDVISSQVTITFTNGLRYIPTSIILRWINEYEVAQNPDTLKRNDVGIRTVFDYSKLKSYIQNQFYNIRNLVYISWSNLDIEGRINRYTGRLPFWYVYGKVYTGDNHQRFWLNQCVLMRYDDNEVDLLMKIKNSFQTEKSYIVTTKKFSNTIIYDGVRGDIDENDIRNAAYEVVWFNKDRGTKNDAEESLGWNSIYYTKHWYDTFNREHYHKFFSIYELQKYFIYNLYRSTQEQEVIIRSDEYSKFRRLVYDSRILGNYIWKYKHYDMITVLKLLSVATLKISNIKHFPTNYGDSLRFLINEYIKLTDKIPLLRSIVLNSKYIYLADWQYKIIENNPEHPPYNPNYIKIIQTDEEFKPIYSILPQSEQGVPGIIIDIPTGNVINQIREVFLTNVNKLSHDKYKLGSILSNSVIGVSCITSLQSDLDDSEDNRIVTVDTDNKFKSMLKIISLNGEIKRRLSDEMRLLQFNRSSDLDFKSYNDRLFQIYLYNKNEITRTKRNGSALKILNLSLFAADIVQKRLLNESEKPDMPDLSTLKTTFLYWGSIGEDGAKYLTEYYPNINTVCIGDNAIKPNLVGKLENVTYTGSPSVVISDINVYFTELIKDHLRYYRDHVSSIVQNLMSSQATVTIFKLQYQYHQLLRDIKDTINNKIYSGKDNVDTDYNIYFMKVAASPAISSEIFCLILKRNTHIDDNKQLQETLDAEILKRGMLKSNADNGRSIDIYISLKILPNCGVRVKPSNIKNVHDLLDKQVEAGDLIVMSSEYGSMSELIGMVSSLCQQTTVNVTNVNGIISSSVGGFVNDIRHRLFKLHNTYRYNVNSLEENREYSITNEDDLTINRINTNPIRYGSQFRRYALRCLLNSLLQNDKTLQEITNTKSIGGGNYNEISMLGHKTYIMDINTRELNITIPNLYIIRENWSDWDGFIEFLYEPNSLITMYDSFFMDSSFTNAELNANLTAIRNLTQKISSNRLTFTVYEIDNQHLDNMLGTPDSESRYKLLNLIFDYLNENGIQMTTNMGILTPKEFSYSDLRYTFGGYVPSPTITSDNLIKIFPSPMYSLYTLNINMSEVPDCNHVETLKMPQSTLCLDNLTSMFVRGYYVICHT